jgi:peptidoglycan/LPS O-acetylase OafA/YrhL
MSRESGSPEMRQNALHGARLGAVATLVALAPALIAAMNSSGMDWEHEGRRFLITIAAYLAFGVLTGAAAGALRPTVTRRRGAMTVGALLGLTGFVLLAVIPPESLATQSVGTMIIVGAFGLTTGAFLGWWTWRVLQGGQRRDQKTK